MFLFLFSLCVMINRLIPGWGSTCSITIYPLIHTDIWLVTSVRLTSRCRGRASSWQSWHRTPTAKPHRSRRMVKESHHRVDPCPLSRSGTFDLLGGGETPSRQRDATGSNAGFICHWPARGSGVNAGILVEYPAEVTHVEPVWVVRRCAVRPEPRPNFTHWGTDPLKSDWRVLQLGVFSLIPLDLHSENTAARHRWWWRTPQDQQQ